MFKQTTSSAYGIWDVWRLATNFRRTVRWTVFFGVDESNRKHSYSSWWDLGRLMNIIISERNES